MRLVIETATAACSVALLDGGSVLAQSHEIVGRGHAERLVPMIRDLVGSHRPQTILVDCGPGSFTGIRVGIAAARALGLAWGAEVCGFSSTGLIAAGAEGGAGGCAVAIVGGHGELFVQRFAGSPPRAISALVSLPPGDAAAATPEALVIGSGAGALVDARGFGAALDAVPRAADLLAMASDDVALAPRPIYCRAPDAALPA
jgi:tRNA threonylcarbamoyladenosine biosynthesis protein TsaB